MNLNLSQIEAEFDVFQWEWQPKEECGSQSYEEAIKQFYRSKITELLESTKAEWKPAHTYGSENAGIYLAYDRGFKRAVSDQADKISQALK
jgi:hypothetical protein